MFAREGLSHRGATHSRAVGDGRHGDVGVARLGDVLDRHRRDAPPRLLPIDAGRASEVHGLGHLASGYPRSPAEASVAGSEAISSMMVWMNRILSSTTVGSTNG
jgi:hypothetical protein